jgi:iron(III) transport system substrate-binding protein
LKPASELLDAAKKEGKVVFYSSLDVQVVEKLARAFEAAYPGVPVQIERAGAERIFQRIGQERGSKLSTADVVDSSDPIHFLVWKREGWLEPGLPAEVVERWPKEERDPDQAFATFRLTVAPMAYNTRQVRPDQAPKSYADLLDPKWAGKMVKSHPGYSGLTAAATYQLAGLLGWDYFQKLAKQKVMQVQSATEPPKKLAQGERPIAADCSEYALLQVKAGGAPVEPIYATEGTPTSPGSLGVMKGAPHPNAARLLETFLFSREAQQIMTDVGFLRTLHPDVKLREDMRPLTEIKLLRSDPTAQEKATEETKRKYEEYFGI